MDEGSAYHRLLSHFEVPILIFQGESLPQQGYCQNSLVHDGGYVRRHTYAETQQQAAEDTIDDNVIRNCEQYIEEQTEQRFGFSIPMRLALKSCLDVPLCPATTTTTTTTAAAATRASTQTSTHTVTAVQKAPSPKRAKTSSTKSNGDPAGLLVFCPSENKVLLALEVNSKKMPCRKDCDGRKISSHKQYWTMAFGKAEATDEGVAFETAWREFGEEIGHPLMGKDETRDKCKQLDNTTREGGKLFVLEVDSTANVSQQPCNYTDDKTREVKWWDACEVMRLEYVRWSTYNLLKVLVNDNMENLD
jgi:hypothetical protein